MSDIGIATPQAAANFRPRTIALMIAIGIMAFVAMLILGAYAPDLRSGRNGGAHALSNAATGFSGLVRLAAATGRKPIILRNHNQFKSEDLLVATPQGDSEGLDKMLEARLVTPTLIVLPKWTTGKDPDHPGWVRRISLGSEVELPAPLDKIETKTVRSGGLPLRIADGAVPAAIAFHAARPLQIVQGPGLTPLLTDLTGNIVPAQTGRPPLDLLSAPDLLSNKGVKDLRQAAAALALLDWLNSGGADAINFDVTLNGFGRSQSPLKLAFDPPFLAMTLAIAAALLLASLYALGRFGAARRRERTIAFGKAALVDNSAAMIRKAGRETRMGRPYAAVIRDRAVVAFGVPARLRDKALDAYLDGLAGSHRFTDLASEAADAADRQSLVEAAQALHRWEKEKIR